MRNNLIKGKLVLLVDDDSFARASLSDLLNWKGFSVLEARDGRRALEMLKKIPHFPCLIVLDLAMPVMDGRGFLKRRAQDPILSSIPVVVVSGNQAPEEPLPGQTDI